MGFATRNERPTEEARFLSLADAEAVLRATEQNPGHTWEGVGVSIALALLCGLRRSEIGRIHWADIDALRGTVRVPLRRGTSVRIVATEDSAMAWLRWWKRWAAARCRGVVPKRAIALAPDALRRWLSSTDLPESVPRSPRPFLALLRSTYATMHLCAFRKPDVLAANLGYVKAGDSLVYHYEGLVTKGMAQAFWSILPRSRTASVPEPLPPQVERRKAALAAWREERTERDRNGFRSEVPYLKPDAVRRVLEIVFRHPGRLDTGAGVRIALGLFAGFKASETHLARWEDIDLVHRTALRRPVLGGRERRRVPGGQAERRGPLPPNVVALHPTAVAWLALWRQWTLDNGGEATGPVSPKFAHFLPWRRQWLDRENLLPEVKTGQDVFANTYFAMRYPDLQESHPGDPIRTTGTSEAEAFWALLPPDNGSRPPAVRRAVVRRASGISWPRPAKSEATQTDAMSIPLVRTIFEATLLHPGSVKAAPGVYLTLGFFAGLHASEIAAVRWSDIDWDHHVLLVRKPEGHRDESGPFCLDLHSTAVRWLRLWRDWAVAAGANPDGPAVPQPWRFGAWRRAAGVLRGKRWPHDTMRITYRARTGWPSYWSILPSRNPAPAEILPGRSWRHKRKVGEAPYDRPVTTHTDVPVLRPVLPPCGAGLRPSPDGLSPGGETNGDGPRESSSLGLAQAPGGPPTPCAPDGTEARRVGSDAGSGDSASVSR